MLKKAFQRLQQQGIRLLVSVQKAEPFFQEGWFSVTAVRLEEEESGRV